MPEELLKIVTNLGSPKVLVLGDFMLDSYIFGDALRISPEAPVPVLKVRDTEHGCGGAGSVAADVAALGAAPLCVGVIGSDHSGKILKDKLIEAGADVSGLLMVDDRPTVSKRRLIGLAQHRHRQQLMRMDEESTDPFSDEQYRRVVTCYEQKLGQADIVCLQDYDKGLLHLPLCKQAIEAARQQDKKVLVDPAAFGDYSKYTGAAVITPNRKEASAAVGFQITDTETAAKAAAVLASRFKLQAVVITLDKEGAYLKTDNVSELVPTRPRSVYDVTGAGDTVLATLAVALAADCDYLTAVQLANIAAGIEVEKFGSATVTIDEIVNEIITESRGKGGKVRAVDSLVGELDWRRRQKETIVFTNGCFDILHRGHIEFLRFCRRQGDVVVVGLNSDCSVRHIKGPQRPINNQHDRAAVLAALETVDYITIFDEPDPLELIKKLKPDVLVKGRDWAEKGVVGREFVGSYGGRVALAPLVEGTSSTGIIEKVKSFLKRF